MPLVYDENGLAIQTQVAIRDELYDELDAAFGEPVHRNSSEDPLANLVEVLAEAEALTQQALEALSRSFDPDGAIGRQLDARLGLTGTTRKGATNSYLDGLLEFSAIATAPNGYTIRNEATGDLWQVTDGPHTSTGAESIAVQVTAVESGPKIAAQGSTWSNVSSVAGVVGFTNASESATLGRNIETDSGAQRRRKRELHAEGSGPLAAIEGAVSQVDGVVTVRAYHNPATYPVDSDSIPFKATNVVVETNPSTPTDAQKDAIRAAIWSATGGGGQSYGTDVTGTVTDTEGFPQPVNFDLVEVIDMVIEIDLETSTSELDVSPNIAEVVAASVLALTKGSPRDPGGIEGASHEQPGRDVKALDYSGEVARLQVAGLISGVVGVTVRLAIDPAGATEVSKIDVGIRQRASFDAARIQVQEV